MAGLLARVQALVTWFQATRAGRMNARYGAARGAQLSGGIAYAGLFSVFAALTIAFTVVMRIVGNNAELLQAVVEAVDGALPGIVDTGSNGGALAPEELVMTDGLTWASIVAGITLLLSALAVMGALSGSIRAMFGLVAPAGNVVVAKLRDVAGFLLLAVSVLVTAALGIGAGTAGAFLTDLLGLESSMGAFLVRSLGLLGAFGVDLLVYVALIRVVGGARPLRRDLWLGAAIGALGSGVIRLLGTSLVGGASANPLLGAAVAVVTLLLWVNLVARLTLYVAAWTSNPPLASEEAVAPLDLHAGERPNYVTLSAPHTLEWDYDARTGAVQPSEADRRERERAEEARRDREEQLAAALAATQTDGSWLERRLARRRAHRAAREVRQRQTP